MASSLGNNENLATDQHHVPEQEMLEVNGNEENSKRRKRQSDVWNEMTKYRRKDTEKKDWEEKTKNLRKDKEKEDIDVLAQCNHCKSVFDGSSKKGTTHLKNHLERCRKNGKGGEDAQKSIRTSNLTSTDVIKETSLTDWIKNLFDEEGYPTEDFKPSLLNSRKVDILEAYQEEKEKLRKFFSQLSCRISLRIDYFGFWCLVTAHYIDENWKQSTKLIGVLVDNFSNSSLIEAVKDLCLDLMIEGHICSVVDDRIIDDHYDVIGKINRWFTQQGSLPFGGFLVLNKGDFCSSARGQLSLSLSLSLLPSPSPLLEMCEVRKSFENMMSLFESKSATPNMYFSKFCDLYMKLLQAERSVGYVLGKNDSSRLKKRLASVKETFIDKFWSRYNLVLVITAILDPRFKMEIVQLWYNMIYGYDADFYLEKIIDDFKKVYNEYAERTETSSISYLDAMGRPCSSSHNVISPKSELDRYLKEQKFDSVEDFDILSWWSLHSSIFPALA